jgi:RNase H-fold protein (predicted Holliday junction resolvase)
MRAQGKPPSKDWIDAVAAAVILQNYLNARS